MKNATPSLKKMSLAAAISGVLLVPAMHTYAAESDSPSTMQKAEANLKEGWKEGMIEGAYLFNDNLSPLDIDVEVQGSKAVLNGYVDSDVAKSLAEEIAMSIDGISDVDNKLSVDKNKAKKEDSTTQGLMADVSDATITVKVKSKLLANSEVSGLKIDVDTDNKIVTLSGTVNTEAESDLVYYIARNTEGVRTVHNRLEVEASNS